MGSSSSPRRRVEAVLEKAEEDARLEARIMARIKAGARIMDAVNQEIGARPGDR